MGYNTLFVDANYVYKKNTLAVNHLTKDRDVLAYKNKLVNDLPSYNPVKHMKFGLAHEYSPERAWGHLWGTTPQNLNYYPIILRRPVSDDEWQSHDRHFMNKFNNRPVNVSGTIYNVNDIPIRNHMTEKKI